MPKKASANNGISPIIAAQAMMKEVGSLNIDQSVLIKNIDNWYNLGNQTVVFDEFASYLIKAFTTLIQTHRAELKLYGSDVAAIIKHLSNKTVIASLERLQDLQESAKYTEFCQTLFGGGTIMKARDILEAMDAPSQCQGIAMNTECYLCNQDMANPLFKPKHCEHILPVADALFHLNLRQFRKKQYNYSENELGILQREYKWAHECCNLTKTHKQYIMKNTANTAYVINSNSIKSTVNKIAENAQADKHDCAPLLSHVNTIVSPANVKNIEEVIQPIVGIINANITAIRKEAGVNQARAFIIYNYLIMIRFLTRLSGSEMVKAFKYNLLSENKLLTQEEIDAIKAEVAEHRRKMKEAREEEARIEAEKAAASLAEKIAAQLAARHARTERRWQEDIQKNQALSLLLPSYNGGQQGGYHPADPYGIIQDNFLLELQFIALLNYYPIYLEKHGLHEIDPFLYMTPEILQEATEYYNTKGILISSIFNTRNNKTNNTVLSKLYKKRLGQYKTHKTARRPMGLVHGGRRHSKKIDTKRSKNKRYKLRKYLTRKRK